MKYPGPRKAESAPAANFQSSVPATRTRAFGCSAARPATGSDAGHAFPRIAVFSQRPDPLPGVPDAGAAAPIQGRFKGDLGDRSNDQVYAQLSAPEARLPGELRTFFQSANEFQVNAMISHMRLDSEEYDREAVRGRSWHLIANVILGMQAPTPHQRESRELTKFVGVPSWESIAPSLDARARAYEHSWFKLQKNRDLVPDKPTERLYANFRQVVFESLRASITAQEVTAAADLDAAGLRGDELFKHDELAGTAGFDSDIDASVSGPASGIVVYLLNRRFKSAFSGHDSGMVLDLNFYAEGHLRSGTDERIKHSEKGDTTGGSDPNFIPVEDWNPDLKAMQEDPLLREHDMDSQLRASYMLLWESGLAGQQAVERLLANDKALLEQVSAEMGQNAGMRRAVKDYLLEDTPAVFTVREVDLDTSATIREYNLFKDLSLLTTEADHTVARGFQARIAQDPEASKGLQIKVDTLIYECLLRHVVTPAEIDFARYKNTTLAPAAYFNLRTARTLSERFSNESYATEGSVVGVVANKQAGSTMFQGGDREHHKNIELTTDHLFHMANEQFGFAHHHIHGLSPDDENALSELVTTGKYVHRYTNAVKYLFDDTKGPQFGRLLPKGYEFRSVWGKAGGLWEHLKKAGADEAKLTVFEQKWQQKLQATPPQDRGAQITYLMDILFGTQDVRSLAREFEGLHQYVTDCYLQYRAQAKQT